MHAVKKTKKMKNVINEMLYSINGFSSNWNVYTYCVDLNIIFKLTFKTKIKSEQRENETTFSFTKVLGGQCQCLKETDQVQRFMTGRNHFSS